MCCQAVLEKNSEFGGTFHGFGKYELSKMNYIFTDMPCDKEKPFGFPDEPVDGIYISDHRPVCAFVEVFISG